METLSISVSDSLQSELSSWRVTFRLDQGKSNQFLSYDVQKAYSRVNFTYYIDWIIVDFWEKILPGHFWFPRVHSFELCILRTCIKLSIFVMNLDVLTNYVPNRMTSYVAKLQSSNSQCAIVTFFKSYFSTCPGRKSNFKGSIFCKI